MSTLLLSLAWMASAATPAVHAGPPPPPVVCAQNVCLIVVETLADSDGDGFADVDEKAYGSDPYDANSHPPVLDVIAGVLHGTTPSFTEHATELVVLPLLQSNRETVVTGLGSFSLPATSKEQRAGLTLHQQFGIDADFNGFRLDPGQFVSSSGSSAPGGKWSLVAGGTTSSGPDATQATFGKDGSVKGTVLSTDSKGTTLTSIDARRTPDGGTTTTHVTQPATVGADGRVTTSGPTTTTTTSTTPKDHFGNSNTSTTTVTTDEGGATTNYTNVDTTNYRDGTKGSDVTVVSYNPDGSRTETTGHVEQDAEGTITSASWETTSYDAKGNKTGGTKGSCETTSCFAEPDLEMAMGWAGPLTNADWERVAVKLGSTIYTKEGWTPPNIGEPIMTNTRFGPLVALLDPESAVTVIAAGAPTFTSAQPDYDPRLQEVVGAVRAGGQLPPGTSPYQHDEP